MNEIDKLKLASRMNETAYSNIDKKELYERFNSRLYLFNNIQNSLNFDKINIKWYNNSISGNYVLPNHHNHTI